MAKSPCPFLLLENFHREWNIPRVHLSSLAQVLRAVDETAEPFVLAAVEGGLQPKRYTLHDFEPHRFGSPAGEVHPIHRLMMRVQETILDEVINDLLVTDIEKLSSREASEFAAATAQRWCDEEGLVERLDGARRRRNLAPLPEPQDDGDVRLVNAREAQQLFLEGLEGLLDNLKRTAAAELGRRLLEGWDAEDIAGQVLLPLVKPIRRADPIANLRAYSRRSIHNAVLKLQRRAKYMLPDATETVEELLDPHTAIEEAYAQRERLALVKAHWPELTDNEKRVLRLTLHGFNGGEVAERLDKTPGNVRTTLNHALRKLKLALN